MDDVGLDKMKSLRILNSIATICSLFVACASLVNAAEKREFNVAKYGAIGDDKTDNTEAFTACLKAVIEAGGGRMYIPDGVYRGRIMIPGTKEWMTIEIIGESEPTPIFGTIGAFPVGLLALKFGKA
jgi:hypothetical protein